jgi:4-aminobutyrate aminotransferase-like enzyme
MTPASKRNLDYWRDEGDYVLMAMPYADQVLVEGRGCSVKDADGHELLDLASGMFCCVLGHNHPRFVARLAGQLEKLLHTGTQFLSPPVFEAASKLAQIAPGKLQKSVFLSTGTEANEFAFRLAKAATGRTGIMGLSRGYYGTSLATKSCSGLFSHHLRDSLPTVSDSLRLPITPQCARCFTDPARSACTPSCFESLESWIADWSNVAAVIVEPFLSAGGMLLPAPGYLKQLAALARRHGSLFVVDEAQTGFGRTGKWFAVEHHDVEPDILTLSKSAGNGFPAAAVITTAEIADGVCAKGFWSISSHQSDPLAAAAVAAVIDIVREENLVDRARESGDYFMERLREVAVRKPCLANVRGLGLMIGFDLVPNDPRQAIEAANALMYSCRRRGVHLTYGYGNLNFRIIPPLVISRAQIDQAVEVIDSGLEDAARAKLDKGDWPSNVHTRRLLEHSNWKRTWNFCWRSSPAAWVEKAGQVLGRAAKGREE